MVEKPGEHYKGDRERERTVNSTKSTGSLI